MRADEVEFGELGYARGARGSYLDFLAARDRGDIANGTRFQVCLPTPMSVIYAFCTARDVAAIEPAYEKAMTREVELICQHIPHRDLCIQWDVCHDMIVWDGNIANVRAWVMAARNGGAWDMPGLSSTSARTTSVNWLP